jgi:deoxyribose-phosphate aldolase
MSEQITSKDIARMIDHSLLHPALTDAELAEGCRLAETYGVASVCVKPYHARLAATRLAGSDVLVGAVIGFPHGNSTIELKKAEALQVMADGAVEVDMVINIAKAREHDWPYLEHELTAVHDAVKGRGALLKVIFATDFLGDDEIIALCEICTRVGVEFIKTSTGYNFVKGDDGKYTYTGAAPRILELMRAHAGPAVQVKAAGKCSTLDAVLRAREIGVTRVGTGQTATIVEDARKRFD